MHEAHKAELQRKKAEHHEVTRPALSINVLSVIVGALAGLLYLTLSPSAMSRACHCQGVPQ